MAHLVAVILLGVLPRHLAAEGHQVQGHQVQGHKVQGHQFQGCRPVRVGEVFEWRCLVSLENTMSITSWTHKDNRIGQCDFDQTDCRVAFSRYNITKNSPNVNYTSTTLIHNITTTDHDTEIFCRVIDLRDLPKPKLTTPDPCRLSVWHLDKHPKCYAQQVGNQIQVSCDVQRIFPNTIQILLDVFLDGKHTGEHTMACNCNRDLSYFSGRCVHMVETIEKGYTFKVSFKLSGVEIHVTDLISPILETEGMALENGGVLRDSGSKDYILIVAGVIGVVILIVCVFVSVCFCKFWRGMYSYYYRSQRDSNQHDYEDVHQDARMVAMATLDHDAEGYSDEDWTEEWESEGAEGGSSSREATPGLYNNSRSLSSDRTSSAASRRAAPARSPRCSRRFEQRSTSTRLMPDGGNGFTYSNRAPKRRTRHQTWAKVESWLDHTTTEGNSSTRPPEDQVDGVCYSCVRRADNRRNEAEGTSRSFDRPQTKAVPNPVFANPPQNTTVSNSCSSYPPQNEAISISIYMSGFCYPSQNEVVYYRSSRDSAQNEAVAISRSRCKTQGEAAAVPGCNQPPHPRGSSADCPCLRQDSGHSGKQDSGHSGYLEVLSTRGSSQEDYQIKA